MHHKFDPRNDHTADAIARHVHDASKWKCKTLQEVPILIAKWESLQREYVARSTSGEEPMNNTTKRMMLKEMLPSSIKEFLEVQTMLRDELSYDQIKG